MKIEDSEVSKDVEIKYKRNLTESKVNFDKFKVIKDTSNKSYTSGEIGNLIEYFQNRYKKLSGILERGLNLEPGKRSMKSLKIRLT